MKSNKQKPDFLHIGSLLTDWFQVNGRDLPFRKTTQPYHIWICEIIFQQTRIEQGLVHYQNFITRFPDVRSLAEADLDEVLLFWKGLGYYTRAHNLHHAARQIVDDFDGKFPDNYLDILSLKGIGKYTAAAICSISFGQKTPAVDGNFYRVLSRVFADDFDISNAGAFQHFSEIALSMMPDENPGMFNEAVMDLGSEICKPRNPVCSVCPLNKECKAYATGSVENFPVKTGKARVKDIAMHYFFIHHDGEFLIRQRGKEDIWKNLYEFPQELDEELQKYRTHTFVIKHKLTHRNLTININSIDLPDSVFLKNYAQENDLEISDQIKFHLKSFPKPLQNFLEVNAHVPQLNFDQNG